MSCVWPAVRDWPPCLPSGIAKRKFYQVQGGPDQVTVRRRDVATSGFVKPACSQALPGDLQGMCKTGDDLQYRRLQRKAGAWPPSAQTHLELTRAEPRGDEELQGAAAALFGGLVPGVRKRRICCIVQGTPAPCTGALTNTALPPPGLLSPQMDGERETKEVHSEWLLLGALRTRHRPAVGAAEEMVIT